MNILITGGAGYIGSHTALLILENTYHSVVVVDNLSTGFMGAVDVLKSEAKRMSRDFEFVRLDIRNTDRLEALFEHFGFDAVMHFSSSIVVPESVEKPLMYYENNVSASVGLINLCLKYGVFRFVFSSSAAVYGDPVAVPVGENSNIKPMSPYGRTKAFVEEILGDVALSKSDFRYVALRYFNVAGADMKLRLGQVSKEATHLVKVAAQAAVCVRDGVKIFGDDYPTEDGTCVRDYIHVGDLAEAHLLALEWISRRNESVGFPVFNVGYGHGYSVKEVVQTMKDVSGVDFSVEVVGRRRGDPAVLIADASKIKSVLGWVPRYDDLGVICKSAFDWEKKLKESARLFFTS